MNKSTELTSKDILDILTLLEIENKVNHTKDERHIQRTMTRLVNFVDKHKYEFMERFGVDISKTLKSYGIVSQSRVKNLIKRGYFDPLNNAIDVKVNVYPDKFYLVGVWYHKPSQTGVDFHRLTQQDIENLVKLIIADLTGNFKLSKKVFAYNSQLAKSAIEED